MRRIKRGALLDRGIRVIIIPLADKIVRCGSDIVLIDGISGHESGLIQPLEEFSIHTYVEVKGAIDVNSWREGSYSINLNGLTTAGKEEDGMMQLKEDILDFARVKTALPGDELANDIYLSPVVELDAWGIGFDSIDTLDHGSPQRVYFGMSSTLGASSGVRCEKG